MPQFPTSPVSVPGTSRAGDSQLSGDPNRLECEGGFVNPSVLKDRAKPSVGEQIKETASDMMETAKGVATDAKTKVQEAVQAGAAQAEGLKQSAGEQMHTVADKIRQGGEAVSDKADQFGTYLQEHDFSAIAREVPEMIRRYPVQTLLIGVGLGILLGRATR